MSTHSVNMLKKYVTGKVKTLKWKPASRNSDESSNFVLGAWDSQENVLASYVLTNSDSDPTLLQEIVLPSDINCIEYMNSDTLAVGLGNGSIYVFNHDDENKLNQIHLWNKRHSTKLGSAACSGIASNGDVIASVGEDGKLNILSLANKTTTTEIDSGKGCSELAVVFSKANEVLTSSLQGHLRLWDLRALDAPKATYISPDQLSVNCLAGHPTQQHIIAAGCEDGSLAMWDMRHAVEPFALISAHRGEINDVQFHPSYSHHLFTCGSDGQVLHWDSSFSTDGMLISSLKQPKGDVEDSGLKNAWLSHQVAAGMIDTVSLLPSSILPVNALNIEYKTLLAGSDNEAIYIINNILK